MFLGFINGTLFKLALFTLPYIALTNPPKLIFKVIFGTLAMTIIFVVLFVNNLFFGIVGGITGGSFKGSHCNDLVGENKFTNSIKNYKCEWLPWYTRALPEEEAKSFLWNDCMSSRNGDMTYCSFHSPNPVFTVNTEAGEAPLNVVFSVIHPGSQYDNLTIEFAENGTRQALEVKCEQFDSSGKKCLRTNKLQHTFVTPGVYFISYQVQRSEYDQQLLEGLKIQVDEASQ
ncbi:hypothetical protein KC872_04215 [Candidatus Kaiserbacteria bacterium]|nr:hypothetical protein [Candidatus Kaiserbacteria bacterium]